MEKRKIDLFFTPAAVTNERLKGYTAIVIDVLRAATSIATALDNGAKDVIPADASFNVVDIAGELHRDDLLLCGERDSRMVEGFHLGNSPSEFTREKVRGKTLVFGSTNGTPAVIRSSVAKHVFLCGFINLNAVIDAVLNTDDPFPLAIVCAGKQDAFALEDAFCAGLILERITKRLPYEFQLNDGASTALLLTPEYDRDVLAVLRHSEHGQYLIKIGFEDDLLICARDSVINVVPSLSEGKLTKADSGS